MRSSAVPVVVPAAPVRRAPPTVVRAPTTNNSDAAAASSSRVFARAEPVRPVPRPASGVDVRAWLGRIEAQAHGNSDYYRLLEWGGEGAACTAHHTAGAASPLPPMEARAPMPATEPVTLFHSKRLPPLSLVQLADALQQQGRAVRIDDVKLAIGAALLVRYCERVNETVDENGVAVRMPTLHSMHRLFVACVQVGMKAHADDFYRNDTFASISGIQPREMNVLEGALLHGLDWRVVVTAGDIPWAIPPRAALPVQPTCVQHEAESGSGSGSSSDSDDFVARPCDRSHDS